MSDGRTAFEVALPGPSLDNPLLWERHAERIESFLRERHPAEQGFRVTRKSAGEASSRHWDVRLQRGWLSGACVSLRPLRAAPHRARVGVDWDSRLGGTLGLLLAGAALPVVLALLVLAVLVLKRFLLSLLLVGALAAVWVVCAALAATLVARLSAALFGNEFDCARRSRLATELEALPLPTRRQD